jgi:type IV secretory pathway TraG/TraD family ATPase VirD4
MPALVVIDEFSALSVEQVTRLFGRARSAGVSLLLGTQELADLRLRGGERTLDQVLGNLSVLIAHRQVVPASAELIARLAGTRGAWRVVHRSGGQRTWSRAREPVLDASRVTSLATGWAAVTNLAGGTPTRLLRIEPHERSRSG